MYRHTTPLKKDRTWQHRRAKNQLLPFASYDSEDEPRDSTTKRRCGRKRTLMAVFNDDYFGIDWLPFNGFVAEKLNCTNWYTRPSQAMRNSCVSIRQQWAKQNAEIQINCTTEPHTKWNFLFCLVFVVIKDLAFDLEPFGIGWIGWMVPNAQTHDRRCSQRFNCLKKNYGRAWKKKEKISKQKRVRIEYAQTHQRSINLLKNSFPFPIHC